MGDVISLVEFREKRDAPKPKLDPATEPFSVGHTTDGYVYLRANGVTVLPRMTPAAAKKWALALNENARAAGDMNFCGCDVCETRRKNNGG